MEGVREAQARFIKLGIAILVILVGAYTLPQFVEKADGPCGAVVNMEWRHNPLPGAEMLESRIVHTFGDVILSVKMAHENPGMPPGLSCAILYWKIWLGAEQNPFALTDSERDRSVDDLLRSLPEGRRSSP